MSPEPTPTIAPPEPAPPEPVVPVSMIGKDGNFVKDWQRLLDDETLHEDKTLQTQNNLNSLAKSYVHVRKQVPLDKIAIPNENTTDEEMEAFYIAGGRPPTAVDYNIARPEDFPEEHWNADLALAAQDLFHKIGLNSKQAAAINEFNNANIMAAIKSQNDAIITNRQEIKDGLYKDWGAAYEAKKHQGNYAVEKGTGGDEDFKTRLCAKFGDDPDFIRFTSNLGGKFAEHGDIVESKIPTPGDIQTEINKEMQTEAYKSGRHPDHKAAVQKVARLFQEKNKVTPTGR